MSAFIERFSTIFDRILFGSEQQLKERDLRTLIEKHPFSKYLNYSTYDHNLGIYINSDCGLGMLWECAPLTFASAKTITTLEGVFRAGLPKGSVMQFILYADPHIDPMLQRYSQCRVLKDPIVQASTQKIIAFISKGRRGLGACADIPVRNFRLFVAVTIPGHADDVPDPKDFANQEKTVSLQDMQRQITETLKAARLHPRNMPPERLIEWQRRLFNVYPDGYPEHNMGAYSDLVPLNKQIINADTQISKDGDCLQVGPHFYCCATPKTIPTPVDPLQTNALFGGIRGLVSDMDQIKTGFLYCFNIVFEKGLEAEIHGKCNLVLQQKSVGSLSPLLQKKQEEYLSAVDAIDHGVKFVRIIPVLWVFGKDTTQVRESCTRARRMWEDNGYVMQQENAVLVILFLGSLPFGLRPSIIRDLERDFIAPVTAITPLLPVQGDFKGTGGDPKLMFVGRKGQLTSFDLFAPGANNHNMLVAATSGSGKSFFINYLAFNYHACGALVRIIDIGGSYKKMANLLGVRYLDFEPGTKVCLNPFSNIEDPEEELKSVTAVFAQMAYANSDTDHCDDTEMNLMRNAVRWSWEQQAQQADADDVYAFLTQFPDIPGANFEAMADMHDLIEVARKLAFNIREFTSNGYYGKFFIGPSTFDIRRDDFIVLELENLKVQPDLYRVVTLLVINAVTQDLYLSDRSRPRLVIFEEAWQFLGKAAMLATVVEEGYRRARKYHGSFSVVIQSPLDLDSFGAVGKVINGNSAFKAFLETSDFEKAKALGLLDYDAFTMELVKSVKSNPPNYSEIFFDTPFGYGVARLVVNPYAYFVYTSNAKEIAQLDALVRDHALSYHEAILELAAVRERHGY